MKTDRIFIGNIRLCTQYDSCEDIDLGDGDKFGHIEQTDVPCKEDVLLIKKGDIYIDFNFFVSSYISNLIFDDLTDASLAFVPNNHCIYFTSPSCKDNSFIDPTSLKPYIRSHPEVGKRIKIKELKKQYKR